MPSPFTKEEAAEILKQYKDLDLSWYQSTRGPQLSATIIGFTGLFATILKIAFKIEIGPDLLNLIITAGLLVGFGIWTLYGHFAGRKQLLGQIAAERYHAEKLGASLGHIAQVSQTKPHEALDELERLSKKEHGVG